MFSLLWSSFETVLFLKRLHNPFMDGLSDEFADPAVSACVGDLRAIDAETTMALSVPVPVA